MIDEPTRLLFKQTTVGMNQYCLLMLHRLVLTAFTEFGRVVKEARCDSLVQSDKPDSFEVNEDCSVKIRKEQQVRYGSGLNFVELLIQLSAKQKLAGLLVTNCTRDMLVWLVLVRHFLLYMLFY